MNKHGKFKTVIRLYDKYELAFSNSKDTYTDRMKSQFEFARDNIGSMGINMSDLGDAGRVTTQNLNKILFSKFRDFNILL